MGTEQPPSEPRDEHATIDLRLDDGRGLVRSRRLAWRCRFCSATALGCSGQDPAKSDVQESKIRESVVKISATMRYPDMTHPWTKHSPQEASGTGVVIDGKRILTNAHVVLYASQLFVESYQSSDKLPARVEAVSPGIDLAVIRLEDESFFDKRTPVVRTEALPEVKETVLVYGYPQGGLDAVGDQGHRFEDRVGRLRRSDRRACGCRLTRRSIPETAAGRRSSTARWSG